MHTYRRASALRLWMPPKAFRCAATIAPTRRRNDDVLLRAIDWIVIALLLAPFVLA